MNVRTRRVWGRARVGALGLVAAGALASFGSPAYAAGGADLSLTVSGERVAADSSFKLFTVKLLNKGPDAATGIKLEYDFSALDENKLGDPVLDGTSCEETKAGKILCSYTDLALDKDLTVKLPFALSHKPGATGAAGSFSVTVSSDNDSTKDNNSKTVNVEIPGNGVDLVVFADDVYQVTDSGEWTDKPIPPGGTSYVIGSILNQGDAIAKGVKVSVTLPKYVTFDEVEPGCTYTADNRMVTCDYTDMNLVPLDMDTDENDDVSAADAAFFPVKVADDAPGPVVLNGGTFTAAAIDTEENVSPAVLAKARSTLPANVKHLSAAEIKDVDATDNTDEFAVHVGESTSGGGGGLPVTGVQAGLIGGVGAGVLAVGAVLFMLARRRRVVLVTPGDETPTV